MSIETFGISLVSLLLAVLSLLVMLSLSRRQDYTVNTQLIRIESDLSFIKHKLAPWGVSATLKIEVTKPKGWNLLKYYVHRLRCLVFWSREKCTVRIEGRGNMNKK